MSSFIPSPDAPSAGPQLRDPRREVLDNGIVLLSSASHETRSVAIRASFPAGSVRENVDHAGLASFTARLLRRGSRRRSAQEISGAVEDLGGSFGIWAGSEEAGFSAKCLDRDVETVLALLQEVLAEPLFAEEEIARVRGEIHTELEEVEDSPRGLADRSLARMLYPAEHPYSRAPIGSRETVDALDREDFRAFHERFYGPHGLKVSLAGAFDGEAVRRALAGWYPGREQVPPVFTNAEHQALRIRASDSAGRERIPLAHKSQVAILMAGPGIPRDHPDFFPLSMINLILGSLGLMGRLGERVRDQHGMAYSVSCRSNSRLWSGEWAAGAGVSPGNEDRAVELILEEVQRVRDELVTDEELADAQANLIGSLPLRMETSDGIAAYLLSTEYYGLGVDYLDRYPALVRAVTRETMREAARTYMDPAGFSCVMAGPV